MSDHAGLRFGPRIVAVLALVAALGVGCGGDSSEDSAVAPDRDVETSGPESTEPTEPLPQTVVELGDISLVAADSDIETLLGYAEGGDDPCAGDTGELRDAPVIVDSAFNEASTVQIGWAYTFCWGQPSDSVQMRDPGGDLVPQEVYGPTPLLPGSPVGTYTVISSVGGRSLEAEVEVVPASDPRLFEDPSVQRMPTEGDPSTASDLLLYLVGFQGQAAVPVAAYEGGDGEVGELMGVVDVAVDESGSGALLIERSELTTDLCVTIVADPADAVERWGEISELEAGVDGYYFGNTAQMVVPACFAPG